MRPNKFTVLVLLAVMVIAAVAYGQTSNYIRQRPGFTGVWTKMSCPTEGDYVFNTAATAADTSATYSLPSFSAGNCWWCVKPSGLAGDDSCDIVVYLDVKSTNLVSASATYGGGWKSGVDSSKVVTADSLYGVFKNIAMPPGSNFRIRTVGVSGNGSKTAVETWLYFAQPSSGD